MKPAALMSESEFTVAMLRVMDADEDVELTSSTINFIASLLDQTYPLTDKQQEVADRIIDEYWTDEMSAIFQELHN